MELSLERGEKEYFEREKEVGKGRERAREGKWENRKDGWTEGGREGGREQLHTTRVQYSSCSIYTPKHFSTISSFDYNAPYIVSLGRKRIISGMDRGLVDMCLWERRRITIPPHLGYGSRGVGSIIPPEATLIFYVRLIKIERVRSTSCEENASRVGDMGRGERSWRMRRERRERERDRITRELGGKEKWIAMENF